MLVGPGRYTSDLRSPFHAYQIGPQGQNVAIPTAGAGNGTAAVTASRIRSAAHNWTINDKVYGIAHTRGVYANRDIPSLTVSDIFTGSPLGGSTGTSTRPGPTSPAARTVDRLVFAHPTGRRLTITTNGKVSGVVRGVKQPVQGYNFPEYGVRYPAYEVVDPLFRADDHDLHRELSGGKIGLDPRNRLEARDRPAVVEVTAVPQECDHRVHALVAFGADEAVVAERDVAAGASAPRRARPPCPSGSR